jgi:inosine-uridine nucleoside N-ribohydrolase
MKILFHITLALFLVLAACSNRNVEKKELPIKVIFDTDLGPDYDDVGALAFLHAMADSGKVEILATVASNKHELVAPSIEVINTYFGRPELAIGAPESAGVDIGTPYHWPDSIIRKYPHTLDSTSQVEDAVKVYRKILNTQPDKSVTIVTVGFLTNLRNLLLSKPDSISHLSGKDLVVKKVKNLVSMAGWFPEGKEFNVHMDSVASEYVFRNWPGEIIFTGYEVGAEIKTGLRLINSDIQDSPVKDAFRISISQSEEDKNGRMSWDETAVLIAVYGTEGFFDVNRGTIIVHKDGSNTWKPNKVGMHRYVIQKMPAEDVSNFIEERMMHLPLN